MRRTGAALKRQLSRICTEWNERHLQTAAIAEAERHLATVGLNYRDSYLVPLLWVLAEGFKRGSSDFLKAYSAERMCYVDKAALNPILAADADSLVAHLRAEGLGEGLLATFRTDIEALHARITSSADRILRIAYFGDCAIGEIRAFFRPAMLAAGVQLDEHNAYFSVSQGVEFDASELRGVNGRGGCDLAAMTFLTFEGLPIYRAIIHEAYSRRPKRPEIVARCGTLLSMVDNYVAAFRSSCDAPILLHGCCALPVTRARRWLAFLPPNNCLHRNTVASLNEGLRQISEGHENVIFIDESRLAERNGIRHLATGFLPKLMQRRSAFHYSRYGSVLAQEYTRIAKAYAALGRAKVLLVDFDHTLWDGIMAEGEVVHDLRAQTILKTLKDAGILLVSLSKNTMEHIRWDEMVLEEEDFVRHKINWNQKAKSVLEVADELDLDVRSFVMIDDNPVERDLVERTVPGVTTLDPTDPNTWDALELMLKFPATAQTEEAQRRTAMYKDSTQRRKANSASVDYPTMMRSLGLKVGWRRATEADLDRAHELVNRTNQFNTTTKRFSKPELSSFISSDDHALHVATLRDKFGSLGIVGATVSRREGATLFIENVVMSCRAMGFGLELCLVARAVSASPGVRKVVGRFEPSQRNQPSSDLFQRCGFALGDDGDWVLDDLQRFTTCPDWLAFE